jgi:hypothetical protein
LDNLNVGPTHRFKDGSGPLIPLIPMNWAASSGDVLTSALPFAPDILQFRGLPRVPTAEDDVQSSWPGTRDVDLNRVPEDVPFAVAMVVPPIQSKQVTNVQLDPSAPVYDPISQLGLPTVYQMGGTLCSHFTTDPKFCQMWRWTGVVIDVFNGFEQYDDLSWNIDD